MRITGVTTMSAAFIAMGLAPAFAQAPPAAAQDTEIVVTALKREQSLQDVPASVTALSADALAQSGVANSFDLQKIVPGLAISYGNRETNVAIRGVSNNVRSVGSDPSNAVHLDGVYLPQSSMILTDLFDVARVEVLKGPQGTLYGRNATGGALNVISRAPTEGFGAEGFIGVGSNSLLRGQVALNGGNESVAGRLALSYAKDDGYTKNIQRNTNLDAQDFSGGRGAVRFQLSPDVDLTLMAHVTRDDGTVGYGISTDASFKSFPANFYAVVVPAGLQRVDERNIRLDAPVFSRRDSDVYAATLNWKIGDLLFKSITGITKYAAADALDYDFTGDPNETFTSQTSVESKSQEFQLSNASGGKLEWTTGLYVYSDEGDQAVDWRVPFPFARATTTSEGSSKAIYGQATYKVTDQWAVMAGARYNDEEKKGSQRNLIGNTTSAVKGDFQSFTPQVQLQYRPNADVLAYVGVSKGFKSGGFNLLASGPPTAYEPEEIVAYEAGLRSTILDGKAIFNASVFHYDYTDLQLRTLVFTGSGGGAFATVNNAEGAKITGVELNTDVKLGGGFSADLNATYLDATFDRYISPSNNLDLSGTRLPLSPEWSGAAGLTYEGAMLGGDVRARVEYAYRSEIIFPLTIDAPQNFDASSGVINATARWTAPKGGYYLEVIGRNLGDDLYRVQRADVFFSGVYDSFGPPRTGEVRLGFTF